MSSDVAASDVVTVHLEVIGLLTSGTFGNVFHVKDGNGRKLLLNTTDKSEQLTADILHSIKLDWGILKSVGSCEFLMHGLYAFQTNRAICRVLEYVDSCTLFQYAKHVQGGIAEAVIKSVTVQLTQALHHLHSRRLIHRNLIDDNVLITQRGRIKLMDFGLVAEAGNARELKKVVGTNAFMAPELLNAFEGNVCFATDFWSLGVILFDVVAGELPYKATHHKEETLRNMKMINFSLVQDTLAREVLAGLLRVEAKERVSSLSKMKAFKWFGEWNEHLTFKVKLDLPKARLNEDFYPCGIFDPMPTAPLQQYEEMADQFPFASFNTANSLPEKASLQHPKITFYSLNSRERRATIRLATVRRHVFRTDSAGQAAQPQHETSPEDKLIRQRRMTGYSVAVQKTQARKATRTFEEPPERQGILSAMLEDSKVKISRFAHLAKTVFEKLQIVTKTTLSSPPDIYIVKDVSEKYAGDVFVIKLFPITVERVRVLNEFRVLMALQDCDLFVTMHNAYETSSVYCLMMRQFQHTMTLKQAIKDRAPFQKQVLSIFANANRQEQINCTRMLEEHWRPIMLQLIEVLSVLQERNIIHNNLSAANVLVDFTTKRIRCTGFSKSIVGMVETSCPQDQRAVAQIFREMGISEQDRGQKALPDYLSTGFKSAIALLEQGSPIQFDQVQNLDYFKKVKLSADFSDSSQNPMSEVLFMDLQLVQCIVQIK